MTGLTDAAAMSRALELAAQGRGLVSPNPMVGCVIVRDGEIIGEGWHHACGQAHGEPDALAQIGYQAQGATLYVNLEPCCHWGRTPPCTEASGTCAQRNGDAPTAYGRNRRAAWRAWCPVPAVRAVAARVGLWHPVLFVVGCAGA